MNISFPPKRIHRQAALVVLLLILVAGSTAIAASARTQTTEQDSLTPYVPGELLVGLAPGTAETARAGILQQVRRASQAEKSEYLFSGLNDTSFYRLSVPSGQEMAALASLADMTGIAFAEPNYLIWAADVASEPLRPNDPLYPTNQWGTLRVGASRAWQFGTGAAVQVAVIDTGIDFNHPEFAGRLLSGKNYVTPNTIKCPQAKTTAQDDAGHGTHVAGIIAASLNNSQGIAGLAPNVLIDPRKALDCQRVGTIANVSQAIRDAADAGAQIINLSMWTTAPSATLEAAVNDAAGKGVLLVAAAGNRAPEPVGWPAAYPATIAVAATDRYDQWANYSNSGPEITLAAPGGTATDLLVSTWPTGLFCASFSTPGYCTANGTSMSAAYVSGGLALLWGNRPDLSPAELRALLLATVRPTGSSTEQVGAGRLDLKAAMRRAVISDLQLDRSQLAYLLEEKTDPFQQTITLSNPSSDHLFWQASVDGSPSWLSILPAAGRSPNVQNVRYGQPAQLTLQISPTLLSAGSYNETVTVQASRTNGSQIVTRIPVDLYVQQTVHRSHLPFADSGSGESGWALPDEAGRTDHRLTNDSSIGLLLPFTYTVAGQSFTTVRLYADGFLTFPATTSVSALPVTCLPEDTPAHAALYGWWADLDPGSGGQISSFRATDGGFVLEFADVPAAGQPSPYRVSFQMVLYPDGSARLHYGSVPDEASTVVIGMEMWDSLLYAELVCHTDTRTIGALPASGQSATIQPTDLR